jgi:hypothetical protein
MGFVAAEQRQAERDQEILRQYDGVERVALLPYASFIAVVPGTDAEEPAYVFIEWAPDVIERPYPGSAIWRAALERYLAHPRDDDPTYRALRPVVMEGLDRFPSLEAWLRWADRERVVPTAARPRRRPSWPTILWPW